MGLAWFLWVSLFMVKLYFFALASPTIQNARHSMRPVVRTSTKDRLFGLLLKHGTHSNTEFGQTYNYDIVDMYLNESIYVRNAYNLNNLPGGCLSPSECLATNPFNSSCPQNSTCPSNHTCLTLDGQGKLCCSSSKDSFFH